MELQIFGTLLFTAVRTRDAMSGAEMIACAVTRKTVISQGSRSTSWTLSEAALTEWRAGAVRVCLCDIQSLVLIQRTILPVRKYASLA